MKKFSLFILIFSLIVITSIIKNSTKKIEDEIKRRDRIRAEFGWPYPADFNNLFKFCASSTNITQLVGTGWRTFIKSP